jgi:hypothetical protein
MKDISIEVMRSPFMRGDELVASALYATGVIYQGYGVAMAFDSTV